jgi:DNA-binding transcriptional LysR family regulator
MNIRSVDLNLLTAFDALYAERSVTRAADRLAVTQPTVSGMLRRLRHTFGDQLFVRTSHGISPTPRAEKLAIEVRQLLDRIERIFEPEQFHPASAERIFTVSGSDYMQVAILAPLAERIRQLAPQIRISISPRPAAPMAEKLASGDIHLLFSSREAAIPELPSITLFQDRYVCIGRRQHPLESKRISLDQLCGFEHLLVAPTGSSFTGPIDELLKTRGLSRKVAIAVPSFQALFDLIQHDDFLAYAPLSLLRTRADTIRVFETELEVPPFDAIVNWHPRFADDPAQKWLRNVVLELIKEIA